MDLKICDRCGEKAVDEIIVKSDDTHTDVCGGCRELILQAMRPNGKANETDGWTPEVHKRRGRPPKNLEQSK